MTQRAVGRIEVWDVTPALRYTINDAVGIYYKEIITEGVGNFNLSIYSHKDFSGTYTYPDIALNDKVKIWLDYDAIAGDPNFIGKVTKRTGPHLTPTGWVRRIAGLSQGEILLRRLKKNKYYDGLTPAFAMVEEWADDLGLGKAEIQPDITSVVLEIVTKSYFDLLRWISDYWASADVQIKKDFLVNTNGNLVWKDRPFRTSGVESFTTADFLEDPIVERELEPVKNDIVVYGAKERTEPSNPNIWSESLTNWTSISGALSLDEIIVRMPDKSVKCSGTLNTLNFYRTFNKLKDYEKLCFWIYAEGGESATKNIRLLAPDLSNYFQTALTWVYGNWTYKEYPLGKNEEHDEDSNPSGIWTKVGSPRWYDLQGLQFLCTKDTTFNWAAYIDGAFCFTLGRYSGSASDLVEEGSSGDLYGRRELEVTDDKLRSDSDCAKRAEVLLYQLKNPPIQVTITVNGNDNVLVGDRLTLSIPSEGITSKPFDVIAVENQLNLERWVTTFTAINTAPLTTDSAVNWRLPLQMRQAIAMRRHIRELSIDEKTIH